MALWCYGLIFVEICTATTLVYSIPTFTLIFSVILLKEKVDVCRWIATAMGFVGVLIVLNPTSKTFKPESLLPLVSSFFAFLDVFNKKYITKDSMLHMLFYTALFATDVSFQPATFYWHAVNVSQLKILSSTQKGIKFWNIWGL